MTSATFGLVLNFLLFAGIGAGPCLWLLSGRRQAIVAGALAPVAGFALTTVFGTYFTLLDWPVARWAFPWVILSLLASAALTAGCLPRLRGAFRPRRWLALATGGFVLTAGLSIAPWSLGGLQYTILRGNGSDSFNYLTGAAYLDREPFSWANHVDLQTLVDSHLTNERARELLEGRWATYMMLAFTARIAGTPAYRFEYLFSVLCFLLAYGPVLIYTRVLLKLRARYALLAAVAICAGFWAQLIIDMRADSQQNSIPVLLMIAVLIVYLEDAGTSIRWKGHILLGVAGMSLLFFYPEIAPMVLVGFILSLGLYLWRSPASRHRVSGYLATLAVIVVGSVPMLGLLSRFASSQISYAANGQNNWYPSYFKWLYADPFTGFWGFGPLVMQPALHLLLLVPGIVLTLAFGAGMAHALWPGSHARPALTLAAALSFAACLEWFYLVLKEQYWAGAKGLSFGYVFVILTALGFIFSSRGRGRIVRKAATVCAAIWLFVQLGLAAYRPWLVFAHQDYANYINGHGEYQHHDWNLQSFDTALSHQYGVTVWSDISNPWLSQYIDLALGSDLHMVNIGASRDYQELPVPRQRTSPMPQYFIAENSRIGPGAPVVARTAELSLLKCLDRKAVILSVHNPNGNEGAPREPFFWLGGPPTAIEFMSFDTDAVSFKCRFTLGPSDPGAPLRHLVLTSSGSVQRAVVGNGFQEFRLPAARGLNRMTIAVEEKPAFILPSDSRPLMLQMDHLDIGR